MCMSKVGSLRGVLHEKGHNFGQVLKHIHGYATWVRGLGFKVPRAYISYGEFSYRINGQRFQKEKHSETMQGTPMCTLNVPCR